MRRVSGVKNGLLLSAATMLIGGWALPASAADLGGDCCADLEERVAELEATTARKGNRKVSLTVSGWVSEEVAFWDDGTERNAYVGTNPVEQSRFRFVGEAKIDKDVSAGYVLEIGVFGGNGGKWDQKHAGRHEPQQSYSSQEQLVLEERHLRQGDGRAGRDRDLPSSRRCRHDDDAKLLRRRGRTGLSDSPSSFVISSGNFIAPNGTNLRWSDALRGFNNSTPGDDGRRNVVRYNSPTIAGFTVTAAWGEDDIWDTALIYKGKIGDFLVNARAGYGNSTDGVSTPCHTVPTAIAPNRNGDCEWWGGAGFIQHEPTGLFLYGGYGQQRDNTRAQFAARPRSCR